MRDGRYPLPVGSAKAVGTFLSARLVGGVEQWVQVCTKHQRTILSQYIFARYFCRAHMTVTQATPSY